MKAKKHRDLRSRIRQGRCPFLPLFNTSSVKLYLFLMEPNDAPDHLSLEKSSDVE